ncbi:hypothetical protein RIF29_39654 [Crotalaria pallida]|uniref:Uncharacterized protein n=1 Tax=Crotalaria pallida TaxID=3830 RepID=A0AAN9E427_CROPI
MLCYEEDGCTFKNDADSEKQVAISDVTTRDETTATATGNASEPARTVGGNVSKLVGIVAPAETVTRNAPEQTEIVVLAGTKPKYVAFATTYVAFDYNHLLRATYYGFKSATVWVEDMMMEQAEKKTR